jgi:uncharacterized protein (TIGR03067 family)
MFCRIAPGLIVLGASLAWAGQPDEEAVRREHRRLEGTWSIVSAEVAGTAIPAREFRDLKFAFKDCKFTARRGDEEAQEGTYGINPSKSPREMDISRSNGPARGQKQLAIYQLTGNLLKICSCESGTERPTSFDTRDHPGWTMMTLRRLP